MRDQERYLQHLDHIVTINELEDSTLEHLLPWPSHPKRRGIVVWWPDSCLRDPVLLMLYWSNFVFLKLEWHEQKGHTHEHLYLHFTCVQCMFVWLFHRAKYSFCAPSPLLLLWNYLSTKTLWCNQLYICKLTRNHRNVHNHMLYLCNYLIFFFFLLWENRLNVSGISFIRSFLDCVVFMPLIICILKRRHQGHISKLRPRILKISSASRLSLTFHQG